jgi:hypothetical protein
MAARGNAGATRPVHITFYPKRDYKAPPGHHRRQKWARERFTGESGLAGCWDTIEHDELQGMNEAQAFAGWTGKGRRSAVVLGPGPHAVIFRRAWLPPDHWIDSNPRALLLPNCPQKVTDAVFAEGWEEYLAAAFWYVWELGRSGRHRWRQDQTLGGWHWGEDEDDSNDVMQAALRFALMFPDEPCIETLKTLPVF